MAISSERLKERLLEERARLMGQISRLGEQEYRGAGYGNHIADDATETFEQAKGVTLQQNEAALLEQVEHALRKFDLGTYGICESCGGPIDPARLKALPYALYCLDCQSRRERRGK
jgi:DnaK suppressor protein